MTQDISTGREHGHRSLSPGRPGPGESPGQQHIGALVSALTVLDTRLLDDWGQRLAVTLLRGGRLLVAASGGSAAQAQHLAAEIAGRFAAGLLSASRAASSVIVLSAGDPAGVAAGRPAGEVSASDYWCEEVLARQVRAHGRPGDVLLAMSAAGSAPGAASVSGSGSGSAPGRGRNLVRAVAAAKAGGIAAWCLTGPAPNPLADACDEAVCVYPAGARALSLTATVQEAHQVALHLICLAFDGVTVPLQEAAGQDAGGPVPR